MPPSQLLDAPSLFELWRTSLRLRPLLWVVPCIVGGGALGLQLAALWEPGTPAQRALVFLLLIFIAFAFAVLSLLWHRRIPLASRMAFGAFCFCAMSVSAAWRVLPSDGDISHLIADNVSRTEPLQARVLTLRGFVADHPQRGEFSTQFPLQCIEFDGDEERRARTQGFVWVSAAPDTEVEVGDAIQVQGELRPLPRATNLGQREEHWRFVLKKCWSTLRVKESSELRHLAVAPGYNFERRVSLWRRAILSHYERAFAARSTPYPSANAQLLTAMTFGEGGLIQPLPFRVREEFRIAGLSHVLVASGTQVAFCAALLLGLGKLLGVRGVWLLAMVVPALLVYAAIAGGAPSIMRATVIGVLVTIAVLAGRETDALSLWAAALSTLVILDPAQLLSLSLQLSFAAAWGLIVLAPITQKKLQPLFGGGAGTDLMAFSIGAQLGVLPILLYHFGRVSLAGIGANLLGVPLAGVLVATGIAGLIFPLAQLNDFLTLSVAGIAAFFAQLPGAQIEASPVRLLWTLACYTILLLAIFSMATNPTNSESFLAALRVETERWWQQRRARLPRPQGFIVFLVFAFTLYVGWQHFQSRTQPLRLTMLDAGQGESVLIVSPEKRVVLVDGGGDTQNIRSNVGQSVIVPYLQAAGVRKIDVLVITHPDADHYNGLLHVVREVPVGLVLESGLNPENSDADAAEYQELLREIARRKIPFARARSGQLLNLGSATMQVLAPLTSSSSGGNNDNSVVMRLDHGRSSVLLTGDIEQAAEEQLVRRGVNLQCTILKAAHHGSNTSTSQLLLKAARPQAALISSGRFNRFRHPAPGVLQRLDKAKIPFYRTDLDGAIEVLSDGEKCWIQTTR